MKALSCLIFTLLFVFSTSIYAASAGSNTRPFGVYFESWSAKADGSDITDLPDYVSILYIAFVKPDMHYQPGSYNLEQTGLQFPYDGNQLKKNIQALKKNNPKIKVLLAIGGATYGNWSANVNYTEMKALLDDFQLDGIDVDYENVSAGSERLISIIHALRAELPRPNYLVTFAAMHVCNYGEEGSSWEKAKPQGSAWTKFCIPVFEHVATDIDVVNIMAYDAGQDFSPLTSLDSFQHYYLSENSEGTILLGVEVGYDAWPTSPHFTTWSQEVLDEALTHIVSDTNENIGMMVWSAQKQPGSASVLSANDIGKTICNQFNKSQCNKPIIAGNITPSGNEDGSITFYNTGAAGGANVSFKLILGNEDVAHTGSIPPAQKSPQKIESKSLKNGWLNIYSKVEGADQFIMCQALDKSNKPLGYPARLKYAGIKGLNVTDSPSPTSYTVYGWNNGQQSQCAVISH